MLKPSYRWRPRSVNSALEAIVPFLPSFAPFSPIILLLFLPPFAPFSPIILLLFLPLLQTNSASMPHLLFFTVTPLSLLTHSDSNSPNHPKLYCASVWLLILSNQTNLSELISLPKTEGGKEHFSDQNFPNSPSLLQPISPAALHLTANALGVKRLPVRCYHL